MNISTKEIFNTICTIPITLPLFIWKIITKCSQDYAKKKKKKTMPCAVVFLVFQHNPEEHFRFIPLQNDGMHIAERISQEGNGNI